MHRRGRNRIQGPSSALTSFLREQGISLDVQRQARDRHEAHLRNHQEATADQPDGTPSDGEETEPSPVESTADDPSIPSDDPDNSGSNDDNTPAAASAELMVITVVARRGSSRAANNNRLVLESQRKKGAKKPAPSDDSDTDTEMTGGQPGSSSRRAAAANKPPKQARGKMLFCEVCRCRFLCKDPAAVPPGPSSSSTPAQRILCPPCLRSVASAGNGAGARRKPAATKRRKIKKTEIGFETQEGPLSLVDQCIRLIGQYIQDVESLGEISDAHLDTICRIISKRRELTPESLRLFLRPNKTVLRLYDATRLPTASLAEVAFFCPRLTRLHLDFCGRLDDDTLAIMATQLTGLEDLHLHGPFLVTDVAFGLFLDTRVPQLHSLSLSQVPRFAERGMRALVGMGHRLRSITFASCERVDDACLRLLTDPNHSEVDGLEYLDISRPGAATAVGGVVNTYELQDETLLRILSRFGQSLKVLNLGGCHTLTDRVLLSGLLCSCPRLESLNVSECTSFTTPGLARLFLKWKYYIPKNHGLTHVDFSRCLGVDDLVIEALVHHSGRVLQKVLLNGLPHLGSRSIRALGGATRFDETWLQRARREQRRTAKELARHIEEERVETEAQAAELERRQQLLQPGRAAVDADAVIGANAGTNSQTPAEGEGETETQSDAASGPPSQVSSCQSSPLRLYSDDDDGQDDDNDDEDADSDENENPDGSQKTSPASIECPHLTYLDLSWCRFVGDDAVSQLLGSCPFLSRLAVWGCNRVTECAPTRPGFRFIGRECDSK